MSAPLSPGWMNSTLLQHPLPSPCGYLAREPLKCQELCQQVHPPLLHPSQQPRGGGPSLLPAGETPDLESTSSSPRTERPLSWWCTGTRSGPGGVGDRGEGSWWECVRLLTSLLCPQGGCGPGHTLACGAPCELGAVLAVSYHRPSPLGGGAHMSRALHGGNPTPAPVGRGPWVKPSPPPL